jgi:branched-chain amino acid transport system permease protein
MNFIWQSMLNGFGAGANYALVAASFALIYSTSRVFHFAHAATYTVAAYLAYTFGVTFSFGMWLGTAIAILGVAGLGVGMSATVYEPLRWRSASSVAFLAASLGILIVLHNIISLIYGDSILLFKEASPIDVKTIFGAAISTNRLFGTVVASLLCVILCLMLWLSRVGTILRAVASDNELAEGYGIQVPRIRLGVFAMGSALVGVAGVLAAMDTQLKPDMGFHAFLMGITGAIIGGTNRVSSAVMGGLIVGIARDMSVNLVPTRWQDTCVFGLLIACLLLRPRGLLGLQMTKASI